MLFSRRTIQRMLDENSEWMPAEALSRQVKRLNRPNDPSPLASIWELAVLNALSKIVPIDHEPNLQSKPDIVYRVNGETVIVDVTAVSDRERHKRNPVDELKDEFQRRIGPLLEEGLKGGFCLGVGPQEWRMQKKDAPAIELRIPPLKDFERVIFTPAFDDFLRALRNAPKERHCYSIENAECRLILRYSPDSTGLTLDSFRYTQSTLLDCNPVWNALQKKASQLNRVTASGHCGIILCDADCETLRDATEWDHYGADDIIRSFVRQSERIEFVLTLAPVHDQFRRDLRPDSHAIASRLVYRNAQFPDWLAPVRDLASKLPLVCSTALNARYDAEWRRATRQWRTASTFRGGCSVSDRRIKLSSRDLLMLLAGVLRQDDFEKLPFMARSNPFLQKLANGQLFTDARIEKGESEADDDWIEFEFGSPDPATSAYRIPRHL